MIVTKVKVAPTQHQQAVSATRQYFSSSAREDPFLVTYHGCVMVNKKTSWNLETYLGNRVADIQELESTLPAWVLTNQQKPCLFTNKRFSSWKLPLIRKIVESSRNLTVKILLFGNLDNLVFYFSWFRDLRH